MNILDYTEESGRALYHIQHTQILSPAGRDQSLYLERSIFDNIYNLPLPISYCYFMSGIINPDGLKNPMC